MKVSFFMFGLLIFSIGVVLMLPSILIDASSSEIKTTKKAVSTIMGNVVKEINTIDSESLTQPSKIPALFIVVGLGIMAMSLLFKFI